MSEIAELKAEVAKLKLQLAAETRLRLFAVASLNQRLLRVEEATGVKESDDEGQQPPPVLKQPASASASGPSKPGRPKVQFQEDADACAGDAYNDDIESPKSPPRPSALPNNKSHSHAPGQGHCHGHSHGHAQTPPPATAATGPPVVPQFKIGSRVEVQCQDDNGKPRWDIALVLAIKKGTYKVRFPDGEIFSNVPVQFLRPVVVSKAAWASLLRIPCRFSGFIWLYELGWIQNSLTKHWAVLRDESIHFSDDPSNPIFTKELPLKDLTISTTPLEGSSTDPQLTFSLTTKDNNTRLSISTECLYEYKQWVLFLTVAVSMTNKTDPSPELKEDCLEFSHIPRRAVVPVVDEGDRPEEKFECLAKGYLISKKTTSWLSSADWARRYVTLHEGWLAMRAQKQHTKDVQVIPLRDTTLVQRQDDTANPYSIELSGTSLKPPLILCFDTSPIYMQWCLSLNNAWLKANPEQTSSGLPATDLAQQKPGHL